MPPYTWTIDPNNNNTETSEIINQGNNNAIVYNITAGQFPHGIPCHDLAKRLSHYLIFLFIFISFLIIIFLFFFFSFIFSLMDMQEESDS